MDARQKKNDEDGSVSLMKQRVVVARSDPGCPAWTDLGAPKPLRFVAVAVVVAPRWKA